MPGGALVPHHGRMHPELNAMIAQQRYDERSWTTHRSVQTASRRGFFRRRRDTEHEWVTAPAPVVLLPPPREERDTTGRRVA
jgi:hypothetical protein